MPATPRSDEDEDELNVLGLLMPVHFFYEREGRELPQIEFLEGADVPEPYRSLLVHDDDMTPTLRQFHGGKIGLSVISSEASEDYVMRMVVLDQAESGKPVEFGAIGIRLGVFDELTRGEICLGEKPLGGILEERTVPHTSEPKAYFRIECDDYIGEMLLEKAGTVLYGRCNALVASDGLVFADIVEVLPLERS